MKKRIIVLLAVFMFMGSFYGHNHFGDSGNGYYDDGVVNGWTNSGRRIYGTYEDGQFSGWVGGRFASGSYGGNYFSGTVYGYKYPEFHGRYT